MFTQGLLIMLSLSYWNAPWVPNISPGRGLLSRVWPGFTQWSSAPIFLMLQVEWNSWSLCQLTVFPETQSFINSEVTQAGSLQKQPYPQGLTVRLSHFQISQQLVGGHGANKITCKPHVTTSGETKTAPILPSENLGPWVSLPTVGLSQFCGTETQQCHRRL